MKNLRLTFAQIDFLNSLLLEYHAKETFLMNYDEDLNDCTEILEKIRK